MSDALLQVGVGGIFAILVIREVLSFLRGKHQNGAAGERTVDYWQQQNYEAARRAIDDVLPQLTGELHELRTDTTKIRESQHKTVEALQAVAGKLDILIKLTENAQMGRR